MLYAMGEFDTELELFSSLSLRTCSVEAGLSPDGESTMDLTMYVLEQLVTWLEEIHFFHSFDS